MANRGALRPGDRLPAERDLANNLRISRPSLREGIGHLATFGVLRSVHGVGTFVAKDLRYGPLGEFCELNNFPAWKMFEARLAIEPHVAALAAGRATKTPEGGLARITAPTLVIHGEADPLVRPAASRALAHAIPGARLVTYPGMGHGLPPGLWAAALDEIGTLVEPRNTTANPPVSEPGNSGQADQR
jgi:pimeloyl-ACP methyl ester carboxylesterase